MVINDLEGSGASPAGTVAFVPDGIEPQERLDQRLQSTSGAALEKHEVKFSQSRNDMYWTFYAGADGTIRWTGYDDDFWWENVSKTAHARTRIGSFTGRKFYLDPHSNEVTIYPVEQVQA